MITYTVQQLRAGVDSSGNGRHAIVLSEVVSYPATTPRGDTVNRRAAYPRVVVVCGTTAAEDLRRNLANAGAVDLDVIDSVEEWRVWRDRARGADVHHDGGTIVFRGHYRVPDVGRRVAPFVKRCAGVRA